MDPNRGAHWGRVVHPLCRGRGQVHASMAHGAAKVMMPVGPAYRVALASKVHHVGNVREIVAGSGHEIGGELLIDVKHPGWRRVCRQAGRDKRGVDRVLPCQAVSFSAARSISIHFAGSAKGGATRPVRLMARPGGRRGSAPVRGSEPESGASKFPFRGAVGYSSVMDTMAVLFDRGTAVSCSVESRRSWRLKVEIVPGRDWTRRSREDDSSADASSNSYSQDLTAGASEW